MAMSASEIEELIIKAFPNAKVVITKKMVQEKLDSITQNKDLSEYIL